jgi:hypothetical protein
MKFIYNKLLWNIIKRLSKKIGQPINLFSKSSNRDILMHFRLYFSHRLGILGLMPLLIFPHSIFDSSHITKMSVVSGRVVVCFILARETT